MRASACRTLKHRVSTLLQRIRNNIDRGKTLKGRCECIKNKEIKSRS